MSRWNPFKRKSAKPEDEKALRQREDSGTALKNRVHQSKEDLRQLENAVLRGKITGSKAFIKFETQAEGLFEFVSNISRKIQLRSDQRPSRKILT